MSSLLERAEYVRGPVARSAELGVPAKGSVSVVERHSLAGMPVWPNAFAHLRKDSRYYEIVEDTVCPEFRYRYFALTDRFGRTMAVQPFFVLDQDLVAGSGARLKRFVDRVRRIWPRFLTMRTLMMGCAAGEGHLAAKDQATRVREAEVLSADIVRLARAEKASLIVLKEFPAEYREALSAFREKGFTAVPSMPMTRLDISAYKSFDDYLNKAIKSKRRTEFRKKFKAAEQSAPIELEVRHNAGDALDQIFALYEQVYEKSDMKFEKLTKGYFAELGRRMPDKARFFIWRQEGRVIAFSLCLIEGDKLYGEYLGLDYTIALQLHLYFYVMRDTISWAIANGFKEIVSTSLGYGPKLQMRHELRPLDLYVRHTSPIANAILKRVLPYLEPTRGEETLQKFPNYAELCPAPRFGADKR